jgi:hypothetical protein
MTSINIQNSPLNIFFQYPDQNGNLVAPIPLQTIEPLLPSAIKTELAPILPFLGPASLNSVLDTLWQMNYSTAHARILQTFYNQANKAGHPANSANLTLPMTGVLWAAAAGAIPASGSNPENPGLILTYKLPGCNISFDTGSVTQEWEISFDAEIVFSTSVPTLPITLKLSTTVNTSNSSPTAENAWAWGESTLANFLNLIDFGITSTPDQAMEGAFDTLSQPYAGIPGLDTMVIALNAVGPQVVPYGFTQCYFEITGGSNPQLNLMIFRPAPYSSKPPDAPQNVVAKWVADGPDIPASDCGAAKITWSHVDYADFYEVISLITPNSSGAQPAAAPYQGDDIQNIDSLTITLEDGGDEGWTYQYRVIAHNIFGSSPATYANPLVATLPPGGTPAAEGYAVNDSEKKLGPGAGHYKSNKAPINTNSSHPS